MTDQVEDCIERNSDEVANELVKQEFLDLLDKQKWEMKFRPPPLQHVIIDSIDKVMIDTPTDEQWKAATRVAERLIDLAKKHDIAVWMNNRLAIDPKQLTDQIVDSAVDQLL
jgi:ribosomal protein L17